MKHIGKNIRQLRRNAGLTIAELAKQIEMHEVPLGRIERGENAPSAKILYNIAKIFKTSIDTLFEDENDKNLSGRASFINFDRKRQIIDNETLEHVNRIINSITTLEDICGAQKYANIPLQLPFPKSENGMLTLTQNIRYFMQIRQGIVLDYFELFETCGFRVVALPLSTESLSFYDENNLNAFIFINSAMNAEKQIFRLIYELGMIYLWANKKTANSAEKTEFFEHYLARKFATFFLMPQDSVMRTIRQIGVKKEQWTYELLLRIKHRFGVSAESFLYRLGKDELNIISPSLFIEFKDKIHKYYEVTNFKEPDNSRRILNQNGRIGDLLLTAKFAKDKEYIAELAEIELYLKPILNNKVEIYNTQINYETQLVAEENVTYK